jgi:hypothetical protein
MKTAMKMDTKPAQVSQPIWWSFRTEAQAITTMAATKENHTVHVACVERALRPIETPRIPEPAQRTGGVSMHGFHSGTLSVVVKWVRTVCNEKQCACYFFQDYPAQNFGHVGYGVAPWMRVSEVALHDCCVCVQRSPADN